MECSYFVLLLALIMPLIWARGFHKRSTSNKTRCVDKKCHFNPDQYLTVPQIIRAHGYPSESHVVESSDGYLVTVFRIPGSKDGKKGEQPVLLGHGFFGDSAPWVICDNKSLAFILADEGFDVWMNNERGSTYSKAHVSLPTWSKEYWDFSFHEMAIYDLPATIFYINNVTGKPSELMYIGHSMGSTISFIFCSRFPELAKNLKLIVALAPCAFLTHTKTPLRLLTPFIYFDWIREFLGIGELLPHSKVINLLGEACKRFVIKKICENILFLVSGFDDRELNTSLVSTILKHEPAGASAKTGIHFLQFIKNGNFQEFDYGTKGNVMKYGKVTAPLYDLDIMENPFYFFYGQNDVFTTPVDVEQLSERIPNLVGLHKVASPYFSHLDFLWGKHVYELVYAPMIEVMKNYSIY